MAVNIPEIISVTSESLQAKVRSLLPSQQGFGNDLQASNVIIPVIDLTASAEGSDVPVQIQEAMSFGGVSSFTQTGAGSTTIVTGTGFYRIQAQVSIEKSSGQRTAVISMSDGLSVKTLWKLDSNVVSNAHIHTESLPLLTVFLRSGESISVTATADTIIQAQTWQVADVNGNLVNPVGFSPQ